MAALFCTFNAVPTFLAGCAPLNESINDLAPSAACRLGVGVAQVCDADLVGAIHIPDDIIETVEAFYRDGAVLGPEADAFSFEVFRVEYLGGFALDEVQRTGTEGFQIW
jgi:hypothetical protein